MTKFMDNAEAIAEAERGCGAPLGKHNTPCGSVDDLTEKKQYCFTCNRCLYYARRLPDQSTIVAPVAHLKWELTRAGSALENWGRHFDWCASRSGLEYSCDCGLHKQIAEIRKEAQI